MTLSVHQFRANLKTYVDHAINHHEPVTIERKNGEPFIVMSLEDYAREQETMYVLNNPSLMSQIQESLVTHANRTGYRPSLEELDL
jgi:antitoxin YefM